MWPYRRGIAAAAFALLATTPVANAQNALDKAFPDGTVPPVIERMLDRGIDLTYLGEAGGVPGFLARNGQGQYQIYYVVNRDHVVAGYMFNKRGRNLTAVQLADKNVDLNTARPDTNGSDTDGEGASAENSASPETGSVSDSDSRMSAIDIDTDVFSQTVEKMSVLDVGPDNARNVVLVADPLDAATWDYWSALRSRKNTAVRVVPVARSETSTKVVGKMMTADDPLTVWLDARKATVSDATINTDGWQDGRQQMAQILRGIGRLSIERVPTIYVSGSKGIRRFHGDPSDVHDVLDTLKASQ